MRGVNERRMEIMETLCFRRQETMKNLAFEFGVCQRTIRNDIDILAKKFFLIGKEPTYLTFILRTESK
ncbi:DeoR family transcriptional regulator [Proteiniclasticum ruminis]|jgi:DeoR/GlpR family transcriptional regulator of sugar metabolism|uniref:DeoR family transcriptional regulator n=1 Tax=Proteiniclasticum ruminis TaxID=398199 RepID=UPI0028AB92DA|nr:DeoR family transcriptional regulator [Proteiniclasticum ruminis]